jgi:hypothetical protein
MDLEIEMTRWSDLVALELALLVIMARAGVLQVAWPTMKMRLIFVLALVAMSET